MSCKCKDNYICNECREDLFRDVSPMPNPFEDEPDFELENDVAEVKEVEPTIIEFKNGSRIETMHSEKVSRGTAYDYVFKNANTLVFPKQYKVDFENTHHADLNLLLVALLSEITFNDTHPMFDKIKHLLKEVK